MIIYSMMDECPHEQTIDDNSGNKVCIECGLELQADFISTNLSNCSFNDFERCSKNSRKEDLYGIHTDLAHMHLDENTLQSINTLFISITNDKLRRGRARKSVVFACAYAVLKHTNYSNAVFINLKSALNVDTKAISKGLQYFNLHNKDDRYRVYSTTTDFLNDCIQVSGLDKYRAHIHALYERVKYKSPAINKSNQKSVAVGIIVYFLKQVHQQPGSARVCSTLLKAMSISDVTVSRISSEVYRIEKSSNA